MKRITLGLTLIVSVLFAGVSFVTWDMPYVLILLAFILGPLLVCAYLAWQLKSAVSQWILSAAVLLYGLAFGFAYLNQITGTQPFVPTSYVLLAVYAMPALTVFWLGASLVNRLQYPPAPVTPAAEAPTLDAPATDDCPRFFSRWSPQTRAGMKLIALGTFIGVAVQLGGYMLVHGNGTSLGWTMFILVPFIAGFCVACVVPKQGFLSGILVCVLVLSMGTMLALGWEGVVCVAMASPIMLPFMALGATIGVGVRKVTHKFTSTRKTTIILIFLSPLFIGAADRFEKPYRSIEQRERFISEVILPTTIEQSWALLADMQPLDGPKPLLLQIGLPVPTHCELDEPAVGSLRVCYFKQGTITQRVTKWEAPTHMEIDNIATTLPGRHWLTFHTAGYELQSVPQGTRVIRHTTIGSRLYPRWYWRPLERWGVTSEHDYVLANLKTWAIRVTAEEMPTTKH